MLESINQIMRKAAGGTETALGQPVEDERVQMLVHLSEYIEDMYWGRRKDQVMSYVVEGLVEILEFKVQSEEDELVDPICIILRLCLWRFKKMQNLRVKAAVSKHQIVNAVIDRIGFFSIFRLFDSAKNVDLSIQNLKSHNNQLRALTKALEDQNKS